MDAQYLKKEYVKNVDKRKINRRLSPFHKHDDEKKCELVIKDILKDEKIITKRYKKNGKLGSQSDLKIIYRYLMNYTIYQDFFHCNDNYEIELEQHNEENVFRLLDYIQAENLQYFYPKLSYYVEYLTN